MLGGEPGQLGGVVAGPADQVDGRRRVRAGGRQVHRVPVERVRPGDDERAARLGEDRAQIDGEREAFGARQVLLPQHHPPHSPTHGTRAHVDERPPSEAPIGEHHDAARPALDLGTRPPLRGRLRTKICNA
ncbi:hypothetical protein AMK25_14595 [Micromonospora sp. TSRI0369]|nr:hypothetical protein AMK25_14595 [Micromonospora sp. TSRI0369]